MMVANETKLIVTAKEIARDQNIITIKTQHEPKFRHLWAHTKCQGKNLSELTVEEKKPGDNLAIKVQKGNYIK